MCVYLHTHVKSRASHSARSYVRYVLGQDCNREENNAMEHSIWKQRDRWPRWKSNEQRFLNKAQAETRRVRTLQRTVRCGAEQPVWPAPLRDGPGRRGQRSPAAPLVPWKSGHAPPRGRRGRRSDGKGEAPLTPGPAPAPRTPGSHTSRPPG